MPDRPPVLHRASARTIAWLLFLALFVVYNSNGREIQSYDSQPTKFAAREFSLYGRLTLDAVVAAAPGLADRGAFQQDRAGHYRSAYSVVPSIEAGIVGSLLHVTRLVDLRAVLAPGLVATLTASLLTAGAVTLVFLAVARRARRNTALLMAIGLGLGTNLWPLASRTLWQLETVSFGFALALYAWFRPRDELRGREVLIGAAGLALAGSARLEVTLMIAVLLCGLVARVGLRRAAGAIVLIGVAAIVLMSVQWTWFGNVLGAKPALQAASLAMHGVESTISRAPWRGALGLLVSPSRGVLLFSPILMVPLIGMFVMFRRSQGAGDVWWAAAAATQFAGCTCYSMWWGGYTFGPRYLVDTFVVLVPAALSGAQWVSTRRWRSSIAIAALVWSIGVAATGAFCYPNDRWNSDPDNIDMHHVRLWDWRDSQILRCWERGPSPQNFDLFDRASVRQTRP